MSMNSSPGNRGLPLTSVPRSGQMIDAIICIGYFVSILLFGLWSRRRAGDVSVNEYFLSSNSLRWP